MRNLLLVLSCAFCLLNEANGADCDLVNVRDMGAAGDGVQDDTKAFLAAVEEAQADRKNIYVPLGTYVISRTIPLKAVALTGPTVSAWVGDEDTHMPVIRPKHLDGPAFHMLDSSALEGSTSPMIPIRPRPPMERPRC